MSNQCFAADRGSSETHPPPLKKKLASPPSAGGLLRRSDVFGQCLAHPPPTNTYSVAKRIGIVKFNGGHQTTIVTSAKKSVAISLSCAGGLFFALRTSHTLSRFTYQDSGRCAADVPCAVGGNGLNTCQSGGIGRRAGLKIQSCSHRVRVRVPPLVLPRMNIHHPCTMDNG